MSETDLEVPNNSAEHGIPKRAIPGLCRELAAGEVSRAALARRYGVVRSSITEFAQRHAAQIDLMKTQMDDQFAGLWIASKAHRIAAYQADYQASEGHPRWDHFEHVRVRTQILAAVAEELGQLPPRMQVSVMPVVHVIEGVDLEALK
jgi:hypothetical protein